MKYIVTEITQKELNLSTADSRGITLKYIQELFGIRPDMWIKNNTLMQRVEYREPKVWYNDEEICEITPELEILLKASKIILEKSEAVIKQERGKNGN